MSLLPTIVNVTFQPPTVHDDVSRNFLVGSQWLDTTTNQVYVLSDNTDGAAVWRPLASVSTVADISAGLHETKTSNVTTAAISAGLSTRIDAKADTSALALYTLKTDSAALSANLQDVKTSIVTTAAISAGLSTRIDGKISTGLGFAGNWNNVVVNSDGIVTSGAYVNYGGQVDLSPYALTTTVAAVSANLQDVKTSVVTTAAISSGLDTRISAIQTDLGANYTLLTTTSAVSANLQNIKASVSTVAAISANLQDVKTSVVTTAAISAGLQTQINTKVGGTIAANQVAYGSGTNTIQGSSALTYTASHLIVENRVTVLQTGTGTARLSLSTQGGSADTAYMYIGGAPQTTRDNGIWWEDDTTGGDRWFIGRVGLETGANAGSNFTLSAYGDAGSLVGDVLVVTRAANGAATWSRPIVIGGTYNGTDKLQVTGSAGISGVLTSTNLKRGTGSPESVVTGNVGDTYQRVDGGTGTTLYIKESGTGNTGWVAVASSDLSSYALTSTVAAVSANLQDVKTSVVTTAAISAGLITITSGLQTQINNKTTMASTDNSVYSRDLRAVNIAPSGMAAGLYVDFKENATDGLSDGGLYHGVLSFRSYGTLSDYSGGPAIQIGTTELGNVWLRQSTSATTWGTWNRLGYVSDIATSVAAVSANLQDVKTSVVTTAAISAGLQTQINTKVGGTGTAGKAAIWSSTNSISASSKITETNLGIEVDGIIIAPTLRASTTSGILLENSNGDDIAVLGAAAGTNAAFYGLVEFDGNAALTQQTIDRIVATNGSYVMETPAGIITDQTVTLTKTPGTTLSVSGDVHIGDGNSAATNVRITQGKIYAGDSIVIGVANNGIDKLQVSGSAGISGVLTSTNLKRGTGTPEAVVTGQIGDTYQRVDGSTGTTLYVKESGTGNTGWSAVGASSSTLAVTTVTASAYDATTANDVVLCDASGITSARQNILLYTAVGNTGKRIYIKKIDSTPIIVQIDGFNSQLIDGFTNYILIDPYQGVTLVSTGSVWYILQ